MIIQLPILTFSDLSLLVAISAVALMIAAELCSANYGLTNITINKRKLHNAAITMDILFVITVAIKAVGIIVHFP